MNRISARGIGKILRTMLLFFKRLIFRFGKRENSELSSAYLLPIETQVGLVQKKNKINSNDLSLFFFIKKSFLRSFKGHKSSSFLFNKKFYRPISAGLLIVFLLFQIFFPKPGDVGYGASYTFTQNSWVTADPAAVPVEPANRSGWSTYYSASSTLRVATGVPLQLATSTYSLTVTTDATTSTGFKIPGYISSASNTEVVGADAGASVMLKVNSTLGGSGADGAITVSASTNLNTTAVAGGRTCADAINYNVTALNSSTATLASTPAAGCLAAGDKILLINLQADGTNLYSVGVYEFLDIASVSSNVVTFASNKTKYYGNPTSTDGNLGTATNNQRVMLQRVPQYTSVTINNGGTLTASAWDGMKGGVVAFKATGTVTVNSGGTISANALGYRTTALGYKCTNRPHGSPGESYNALIPGSTNTGNYGGGAGESFDCYGYGGLNPSGGGGYGSMGVGYGNGLSYGQADLGNNIYLGSAGGATGGSNGGGIVYIEANDYSLTGSITSNGGAAGAGAGAGGSVYLVGGSVVLGSNLVTASGGASGAGSNGGVGRIHVKTNNISGSTSPAYYNNALATTYNQSGTYTSGPVDPGSALVSWGTLTLGTTLNGQTIAVKVRGSNNPDMSGAQSWDLCAPVASGADLSTGGCVTGSQRYIQFQAALSTVNPTVTPYLDSLTFTYTKYAGSGTITSNTYDATDSSSLIGAISWVEDSLPANTTVTLETRTAPNTSMTGGTNWESSSPCNKAGNVVSCSLSDIPLDQRGGGGDEVFQYRFRFGSDGSATPLVSSVSVTYVINAPPDIGNITAVQNADGTVSISYQVKDIDTDQDTNSVGFITPSFQYCVNGGSSCSTMTHFTNNATAPQPIPINFSTTTINTVWVPASDTPGVWDPTAKIKITVSDLQLANSTSSAFSSSFTLDTKGPTAAAVFVDASSTPATIHLTATDNSGPIQYRLAFSSNGLESASYSPFTNQTTLTLPSNPSTVYVQFKDAYSNVTDPVLIYATTPDTPENAIVQDITNMKNTPPDYRMFLAWKLVSQPSAGFGSYEIWRSLDNVSFTKIGNITDRSVNFYADSTVPASTNVYYKVFTTDALGNRSFSSVTLQGRADGIQGAGEGGGGTGTGPTITSIATSSVSASSITVTWETDALSNSTVSYSTTPGVFSNSLTVGSMVNDHLHNGPHTVILANLTPDTTYYFSVRSTDINGNYTVDDNGTAGYVFHTTPGPTITAGPTPVSVLNNSATITWQTSLSANSTIFYSTSSNFAAALTTSNLTNYSTDHSLSLADLVPSTKYFYYVRSVDGSGNIVYDQNVVNGVAEYYSFFTTNDVTAPVINNANAAVNTTTAVITWQTDENADSQVNFGTTLAFGSSTPLNTFLTNNHSVSITGLTPNTTYYYQILSRDGNGNLGASVGNLSFLTGTPVDTTPPVISNVVTSSIGLTYATVGWMTSKNTNATVDFGPTLSYGNLVGTLYDYSTSTHSVNLTDLLPNTLYYFRVNSADVIGNSASSTGTFSTAPDITPPVISSTSTLVNDTAAFINWSTDERAKSYVFYGLSDTAMDTEVSVTSTFNTSHSLPLTGLTPVTTYYYQMMAVDQSANTTTAGPFSFTTLHAGEQVTLVTKIIDNTKFTDTSLPTISNIQVINVTPFGATIGWLTDKDSSSLVKYGQSVNYGFLSGDEETMIQSHSVPVANLEPGTTYHFKAKSIDKNGNVGVSEDRSFTTLNIDGTVASPTEQPQQTSEDEKQATLDKLLIERIKKAPVKIILGMLDAVAVNPVLHQLTEEQVVHSFTDLANQIGTAPTIVGLRPQVEVHGNSATIHWSTDKKTTGLVSFAKEADYLAGADHPYTTSIVDSDALSTVHTVELTSLEPATRYHFQVASKGEIGPEAKSKDYTFETEAVLPIVSDAKVTDVKATEATISWKTNVPTASNLEYTNAATGKTLSAGDPALLIAHVFTLQSLEPGSKYSLVIKAKNESGQESPSNPLTFETVIDKDIPKVSSVSANSTLYPGANAKVQTIISWDSNEMAKSQLFYQEGVGETDNIKSLPIDTDFSTKHFVVLTAFKPGLVYEYWIESTDQSGNKGKSERFTTLTPTEKQTIIDIISNNFQSVFGWTKNLGM